MKDLKLSLIVQALDRATAPLRSIGAGLKGLEERTEHLGRSFKRLELAGFLGGGLVIGAAAEAGRGLYELTNKVAELGEGFLHASIKSGATVEQMQRLGFAAKQLGVDQDGLSQVFFRFQTHLANGLKGQKDTVASLRLLGISMQEAKRLSKDPHEAFLRLVDGFTAIKNPTVRAKLAMDLFSRSGYQIMPMLTAGRAAIKGFEDQLDAAHGVMSNEAAEAAEKLIQKLRNLSVTLQGLQMQIGVALLPVMSRFVDKVTDVIVHLKPAVIARFTDSLGKLIEQLPALINLTSQLLDFVAMAAPRFLAWSDKVGGVKNVLIALGALMAGEFVVNALTAVVALGKFIALLRIMKGLEIAGSVLSAAVAILKIVPALALATDAMFAFDVALNANPIGLIALAIGIVVAAVGTLAFGVYELIKHWSGVTAFFGVLWGSVTKLFAQAAKAISISTALPLAILRQSWAGVTAWFTNLLAGVERAFAGAWKRISAGTPDWVANLLKAGAIGLSVAVNPAAAATPARTPAPHVAAPAPTPVGPSRPLSKPPGASTAAPAPSAHGRVDVNVRLDQDGRVKDAKVRASGAGVSASASRGVLPG
jgi:hypothetical protein